MKSVCLVLGVARSNLHLLYRRSSEWRDGRRGRTPQHDEAVLADIRRHITDLPSYGSHRVEGHIGCALEQARIRLA